MHRVNHKQDGATDRGSFNAVKVVGATHESFLDIGEMPQIDVVCFGAFVRSHEDTSTSTQPLSMESIALIFYSVK